MPQYRLYFDVPYDFAIEPGFARAVHRADFAPQAGALNNTFRCPVTGLLMLYPSFMSATYQNNLLTLAELDTTAVTGFWQEVKRSFDNATLFGNVKPADQSPSFIQYITSIYTMTVSPDVVKYDDLKWVVRTKAEFAVDEGFVIHYHGLTDELLRKSNWFALQWDNIGLHFSAQGTVRVFQYDRADMSSAPSLVYEFDICSPSELLSRGGYFVFIPVPGLGLLLYHSRIQQKVAFVTSSVATGSPRGHLIPWGAREVDGQFRLFDESRLLLGANPYQQNVLGIQRLRFATSGDYTDAPFDIGYKPTLDPDYLTAIRFDGDRGSVSASLRKGDNSGAWATATDRKARVKISLSTSDTRYTPFVHGYAVGWTPVFATRNTEAQLVDRIEKLEYSEDEKARMEGKVTCLLRTSALKTIARRGDTTFRLDRSFDGSSWETVFGGLTKMPDLEVIADGFGTWYRGEWTLAGFEERLRETHWIFETAIDGQTLPEAFSNVLLGASLPGLISWPPELDSVKLPPIPEGSNWRFAPRLGDKPLQTLETLLLFGRKQTIEYRLRWDWDGGGYVLERKPRDSSAGETWRLSTRTEDRDEGSRIWSYQTGRWNPEPPEGNIFRVDAKTATDSTGKQIVATAFTPGSLDDPDNPDYLGRNVMVRVPVEGISTLDEANRIVRRIQAAAGHHRDKMQIIVPIFQEALSVMRYLIVEDDDGDTLVEAWVKRRTITVDMDEKEIMRLELDTVWESEITVVKA